VRLAEQALLIAWDRQKQKLTGSERTTMVSAAVLIELWLDGALAPDPKRAVPTGRPSRETRGDAPGRAELLARIAAGPKPRTWKYWVEKGSKDTYRAVRTHLAKERLVRLEDRRFLGFAVAPRVTVRDGRLVGDLVERCRRAVLGAVPVDQVPVMDAALVAVVAAAELNTVFSGKERRAHRERIAGLSERAGPAAKALRSVVSEHQAAAAS
jgi:Golgi phosphoprotein 3 (GPP34)